MQLESGNCLSKVNLSNHFQFLPVLMTTINLWEGVDITDQYHSYYTTQIVAQRNWLPIFFWILDTALLNSFIIYQEFFNSKAEDSYPFSHKEFNVEVA